MSTKPISFYLAPLMVLLVFGLGAWMWVLRPESAAMWVTAMLILPVMWGGLAMAKRRPACECSTEVRDLTTTSHALAMVGLVIAAALGLAVVKAQGVVDDDTRRRTMNVVWGVVIVI